LSGSLFLLRGFEEVIQWLKVSHCDTVTERIGTVIILLLGHP
jgi:hypothetical protein